MNTKIESGRAQIAEAQKHVERLEIDIIGLEIDASRIETQEKPVMEEIYALNRAIFEVKYNDRLDLETRNRGVLSREEKVRTLEVKVAPLVSLKKDVEARIAYTQKNIEDQKSRIIEMKSAETAIRDEFLNGFTKIEGALLAKTNSEGQFHIRTRRGSYAIFANTDRRVGDEVEHYVWVIESAQEFVSLNNDNILK
ncbi:hypothetical protein IMCC26134_02955 [Verrucomicrobia bacterium IMCC26134]|nr:hypothetical protein IMCC26134_02955 [Verrucomicrobia bacterium IMCC26134]